MFVASSIGNRSGSTEERADVRRPHAPLAAWGSTTTPRGRAASSSPRAGVLATPAGELARLSAAGDLDGARILNETIGRLLGDLLALDTAIPELTCPVGDHMDLATSTAGPRGVPSARSRRS